MGRRGTNRIRRWMMDNRRLLLFLLLPVVGCIAGIVLYGTLRGKLPASWLGMLKIERVPPGMGGMFSQLFSSCFQPFLLLALLFLVGLSACGAPVALLIPVFWGIGLGMTQACYYAEGWGGVAVMAAVVLPHSAMEAVALLMGSSESFRMSLRFSVQLLPRTAHCGGLWQDFRLYGVRFLLLLLLLLAAGALDVGLRLLCAGLLP